MTDKAKALKPAPVERGVMPHGGEQMSKETRRCEWCGEIANGKCRCPAEIEIERLRTAIVSMRPMLDKKRLAWKKHADYLDAVLGHNVELTGGASAPSSDRRERG